MKRIKTLLLFPVLMLGLLSGCTRNQGPRNMDPQEAAGMMRNGFAVIVDVREADEIKNGMASGAQWMPFTSKIQTGHPDFNKWLETLPKDKTIIVYCRSGRRSGEAANILASKGFKVANMGGYEDWVKAGLPTVKP